MKNKPNYAFIDSQNLNIGVSRDVFYEERKIYSGWKLDFEKFFIYLKDKFKIEKAFLFIGKLSGQEKLYSNLESYVYTLILKPTTNYLDEDGRLRVKGNVDTDLVLYAAAKEYKNYSKAIIVSGDGDFLSLCEFLDNNKKLERIVIPNKHKFSQLLTKYSSKLDYVSVNKAKLQKIGNQKDEHYLRHKSHKVSRHCDNKNISQKNTNHNI